MGSLSIGHWAIALVLVVLIFGGRGKISGVLGDLGKGMRAFRSGLSDRE